MDDESALLNVLRPILTPLPSLSALDSNIRSSGQKSANQKSQVPRKRPQRSWEIPNDFFTTARSLRNNGIVPDTLFFTDCGAVMDKELMDLVQVPVKNVKRVVKDKKCLLWLTFYGEDDCMHAAERILGESSLKPVLHRPRKKVEGEKESRKLDADLKVFRKRVEKVRAAGGLCNTLLFRNIPTDVTVDEFVFIVRGQGVEEERPLKVRTAESRGPGSTRIMWVVYASEEIAERQFRALSRKRVDFRCGQTVELKPILHNDAGDADTKKRRLRELTNHIEAPTTSHGGVKEEKEKEQDPLKRLEEFLWKKPELCVFMKSENQRSLE